MLSTSGPQLFTVDIFRNNDQPLLSMLQTDPFTDLEAININYLPEYSPIILDPSNPVSLKSPSSPPPLSTRLATSGQAIINGLPLAAMLTVLVPIGTVVFLVNSGIQSVRSQQRIRLHEQGRAGIGLGSYGIPLMIENARGTVENVEQYEAQS